MKDFGSLEKNIRLSAHRIKVSPCSIDAMLGNQLDRPK